MLLSPEVVAAFGGRGVAGGGGGIEQSFPAGPPIKNIATVQLITETPTDSDTCPQDRQRQ